MRILSVLAALAALLIPAAAHAEWHQASSPHFTIFADQSPERLREFAERLERFDQAVRLARSMADPAVSPANRLTVFVVDDIGDVQKLMNSRRDNVAGFYLPRATGSIAIVPKRAGERADQIDTDEIFFHEYAHHLMFQALDVPYPDWLIEGFAEFLSTAKFARDGTIVLGGVPQHRARAIFAPYRMPIETMLGGAYGFDDDRRATVYGRGWLLAHYLTFEPRRAGQLDRYIASLADGRTAPLDAARSAFGDLKTLDRELNAYAARKRLSGVEIKPANLKPVAIAVSPLDPAAAAIHPLRIKLKRGAQGASAPDLLARIRAAAARFPAHGLSQITLAEAELLAGEVDRAEAAADRALAADPKSGEAMLLKGRAIADRARKAGAPGKSGFAAARSWFSKANALDTEDPEPLMLFYRSYVWQGAAPTRDAIAALHYASDLAPFDRALRMTSAELYLKAGKLADARRTIAPLTFDPHNRGLAQAARALLATIDAAIGAAPR